MQPSAGPRLSVQVPRRSPAAALRSLALPKAGLPLPQLPASPSPPVSSAPRQGRERLLTGHANPQSLLPAPPVLP